MADTENCKLDIINRALTLLREDTIDNIIEPQTDTEKLVASWWSTALNEALVEIEPAFAIKRETIDREAKVDYETLKPIEETAVNPIEPQNEQQWLTPQAQQQYFSPENNSNITLSPYRYKYRIPNNCLKIIDVNPDKCLVEGNYIYLDYPENKHTFIFINRDTELYSRENKFNLALSYMLAFYLVSQLHNSNQETEMFLKLKTQKVSEARTFYQQQQGVRIIKKYEWKK